MKAILVVMMMLPVVGFAATNGQAKATPQTSKSSRIGEKPHRKAIKALQVHQGNQIKAEAELNKAAKVEDHSGTEAKNSEEN